MLTKHPETLLHPYNKNYNFLINNLREVFNDEQIKEIEHAFENCVKGQLYQKNDIANSEFSSDHKIRLTEICQNIIDNGGDFIPKYSRI
jgi:hypothetical protein